MNPGHSPTGEIHPPGGPAGTSTPPPPADPDPVQKVDDAYFAYGDHADVYRGHYHGKLVAIKQLRGVNTNKDEIREHILLDLRARFPTWKDLDHPNVCRVYKISEEFGFLPALVLDYYPEGSVSRYIQRSNPQVDQRIRWLAETASGLAYLHSSGVYHGDLRGANIFLDRGKHAVLADYGIAHFFANSDFTSAKSTATVRWTAPEVISLPPDPNIKPDKVDVFALGMTMLEILSGQLPYSDKSDTGAIFAIVKNEMPKLHKSITDNAELRSIFDACTDRTPDKRTPAREVAESLKALLPPPSLLHRLIEYLSARFG